MALSAGVDQLAGMLAVATALPNRSDLPSPGHSHLCQGMSVSPVPGMSVSPVPGKSVSPVPGNECVTCARE